MELVKMDKKTYVVVLQMEFHVITKKESFPPLICANVLKEFLNESKDAFFGQEKRFIWSCLSISNSKPSFLNAQKKANKKKNKMNAA